MKKTLEYIISSLVENEKEVEINENEENGVLNLSIKVAPTDMGRIIGKGGKVIRSIRNIMKISAMKENKKIYIILAENPQS